MLLIFSFGCANNFSYLPQCNFPESILEKGGLVKSDHELNIEKNFIYKKNISCYEGSTKKIISPISYFVEQSRYKKEGILLRDKKFRESKIVIVDNKFNNISIIRPANVYGPYDNFDPNNAMVIPSLIYKATRKSKTFEVWGDGSPIRDFVYSEDVADAMMRMIEKKIEGPLNIGSGKGYSIKEIAENISKIVSKVPKKIKWKKTKHQGDKKRILSMKKANLNGIIAKTSLRAGINKTVEWFIENEKVLINNRYNVFKK